MHEDELFFATSKSIIIFFNFISNVILQVKDN